MEHTFHPTTELMQLAARVLLNPEVHSPQDRVWLAGQLQQRAAAIIEDAAI